jgi:amidophosphoribosyltransferase
VPDARIGIGHTRYGTSHGAGDKYETLQPFHASNFALAHNGHIANIDQVISQYPIDPAEYSTDTHALTSILDFVTEKTDSLDEAMGEVLPQLYGAYSLVLAHENRIIGVRDPWGFRPLCIGKFPDNGGYVFASEESAITAVGAKWHREVQRGEIVQCDGINLSSTYIKQEVKPSTCIAEYAYFSRSTGQMNGVSISKARYNMGRQLAEEHPADADIVVGVPDSGTIAARGFAEASGLEYVQYGIVRNTSIDRTFIQENQTLRKRSVGQKMILDRHVVGGKRLVLVDDSIVRGTTTSTLIGMARDAGATEVHLRITYPPFRHPCYFGIDIGNPDQLLANGRSVEEMRIFLGADSLGFISEQGLADAVSVPIGSLCMACTTGNYPKPGKDQIVDLPIPGIRRSQPIN